MRFECTNEGAGTGRLGALQPPLSCYICWCSNSVSKKWQDNFSGKYIKLMKVTTDDYLLKQGVL